MTGNGDEHNRGGLIAFAGSVVFCLIFFTYVSFFHPGIDLKEVSVETQSEVQVDLSQNKTPWVESAELISHGAKVFKNNCAICHGNEGKGDGAAGAALVPPPRNFVEGKWKQGGSSLALYTTVQNGIEGGSMASFKHLPKVDRWAVVQFIRSITQNKVADDEAKLSAFGATAE